MKIKVADIIILTVCLAACLIALLHPQEGTGMLVIHSPDAVYRYSLEQDRTVEIEGLEGITEIKIEDGSARVISSPCRNRICMRGSVSQYPDTLACLPNGVIISVEGESDVDAESY